MIQHRCRVALFLFLTCVLSLGVASALAAQETQIFPPIVWNEYYAGGWKEFQRLVEEKKYEAAVSLTEKMLDRARSEKNNSEWTRCLIRATQLRLGLHEYEKAVRFLKEQPWPDDVLSSSALNLYYAKALMTYARNYSWEINKREKIEAKGIVDLKAWSRDQIYEEVQKAYEQIWGIRDRLGSEPRDNGKEFLDFNTYPDGIRPTLRDAVSYLRVEMLADTNGWQPDQLNEIYRLNLKALIAGDQKTSPSQNSNHHPLETISFILADLENWHLRRKEREAALEARLERYRQLYTHFRETEDRKLIQNDLAEYLKPMTGLPWWSEGMAQLAEFTRMGDDPDSLILAREFAVQGRTAFPESAGGKHCLAIEKQIDAPEYSLSGMQNDAPQKKSILIKHKNLAKIYFRAYAIDLLKLVETTEALNLLPSSRELENLMATNSPAHHWETALPATPDYRMHNTFIIPPMIKAGTYLIVASARAEFTKTDNRLLDIFLTIGDLALTTRKENNRIEVSVFNATSGKPVAGAEVLLYQLNFTIRHPYRKDSQLSDNQGIVHFQVPSGRGDLIARKLDQITYHQEWLNTYSQSRRDSNTSTLFYTDRSIYRPQQKILWKAVFYDRDSSEIGFVTVASRTFTVSLRDANNQIVESKIVTTNAFGTASGEFTIPSGRMLGQWRLESSRNGATVFRVEEYKRPAFEAKIMDPDSPLRFNQTARLKGEARYYFGLPVTHGKVKWLVRRVPVFPWWWGLWGDSGGFSSPRVQTIASGTEELGSDGTFNVTFRPEIDERLGKNAEITYRYTLSTDITDEGGETRSAQRSFRLGFTSIEASAELEKAFFLKDDAIKINLQRATLDGIPKAGQGKWKIVALQIPAATLLPAEQPPFKPEGAEAIKEFQTPGDKERTRWNASYNFEAVMRQWHPGPMHASGSITHDEKGNAAILIPHLAPGAYRLLYETLDDFGSRSTLQKDFAVADSSFKISLPAMLVPEKSSLKVGEIGRFLVHSGLRDQFMVLEVYRNGKCVRRRELNSDTDPSIIEFPITEEDRGGFSIALTMLRDHQFIRLQNSLMVPWDNKQMNVEFSSFRDRLQPGRGEKWSVKVTGPKGKDIASSAAELLAYMYDRSLDAFAPHYPPDPLNLYSSPFQIVSIRSNLASAGTVWIDSHGFNPPPAPPLLAKDSLKNYGGYGIGGLGISGGVPGGVVGGLLSTTSPAAPPPKPVRRAAINADMAGEFKMGLSPTDAEMGRGSRSAMIQESYPPVQLRSNFSETAFWYPHLLTGPDGSVSFEFKVPDSVTSWNVWVHAITRDLKSGSIHREAQSVKELMVRPYLPRFLREGDQAEIKVVVNNASDRELSGLLHFDIIDVATEQSLLPQFGLSKSEAVGKSFKVAANGGTNLTFPIKAPSKVGQISFKVTASSGDFSDGELRPIPILPGRMHLMQSRFVTLKDQSQRVLRFDDLARNDDPTRINEQMVVTLDSQLFYSVLSALPYLINYPYECTEQTLNRFLSTGILSSLYQQYPAIDRMAKEFSSRQTQFEQWDAADQNRKMALEETPWMQMAKGGDANNSDLITVLDSRIAKAEREESLARLKKAQTSSGGFPWFPGGPPSPYMTLYLLNGFSKALEFGVEVPGEMVKPAWNYLHRHYLDDVVRDMVAQDRGWEVVTFINYVLSSYPDSSWYKDSFTPNERNTMLQFSFKHWKEHSPYLKAYLALTLKRMQRPKDAMLVWESVLDSAKTAEDQGTFWAPEDRSWLWYNDTIESHAFAIRADMELLPEDPKLDGMVLWLFLNKNMNHWKSTRATAEVLYSLARYLKDSGQLGLREDATVTIGTQKTSFVFEPDQYIGKKNQIVIEAEKINPAATSSITVEKTSKGHLFASANWHFSTEKLPDEERGDYLSLSRSFFKRVSTGKEFVLQPLAEGASVAPGDEVEVHLSITSKHSMEYVHLRDPRGAGFEPITNLSKHKWDLGICWYEEIRDSGTNFFFEHIPQGEYTFKYRIRAATAGAFKVAPAIVQPMYAPEFSAYSAGATLVVGAGHEKPLN